MRASVGRLSAGSIRPEQTASKWKWLHRYCFEPGDIASIFVASISLDQADEASHQSRVPAECSDRSRASVPIRGARSEPLAVIPIHDVKQIVASGFCPSD